MVYLIASPGEDAWQARKNTTGCGSAWLERLVWDQEVAGSNPVTPIVSKGQKYMRV